MNYRMKADGLFAAGGLADAFGRLATHFKLLALDRESELFSAGSICELTEHSGADTRWVDPLSRAVEAALLKAGDPKIMSDFYRLRMDVICELQGIRSADPN